MNNLELTHRSRDQSNNWILQYDALYEPLEMPQPIIKKHIEHMLEEQKRLGG